MMMTNYMEVLMSNQPWNLIAFMVLPVAMAELLTAAELFILARPETSAGWKKLSHGLGIALGLYFLGVFLCFILHILPGISFRGWIDKLAIVAYLAGVLPLGAKIITTELGARFLKDYLDGDVYFKIDYPSQNLDRCRAQLRLAADMEEKWEDMQKIVAEETAK